MVIEAAKGGHTQVVKLLLEYPNRMLMNSTQELPQITANETAHLEVGAMHFLPWLHLQASSSSNTKSHFIR